MKKIIDKVERYIYAKYITLYKQRLKMGKETTAEEDELFAHCIINLKRKFTEE